MAVSTWIFTGTMTRYSPKATLGDKMMVDVDVMLQGGADISIVAGTAVAVDVAQGMTVVFGTSAFTMELLDITYPEISLEEVDVTHQGTIHAKKKMGADLVEYTPLKLSGHFNHGTTPPILSATGTMETITVTGPSAA